MNLLLFINSLFIITLTLHKASLSSQFNAFTTKSVTLSPYSSSRATISSSCERSSHHRSSHHHSSPPAMLLSIHNNIIISCTQQIMISRLQAHDVNSYSYQSDNSDNHANECKEDNTTSSTSTPTTSTIEILENELLLIEAIEERNKAQIYSFIDEQDQWDSMEEGERQLLLRKDCILQELQKFQEEK